MELKVDNKIINYMEVEYEDYISITDMLKSKDGNFFVNDWLRNRNTIEFLGIWEELHNPNFNYGEFAIIKSQAGLNSYKLSVKEWRTGNLELEGNIRDYASINELICLVNLENLNSVFINDGLSQSIRLERLNKIAISQIKILNNSDEILLENNQILINN